MRHHTLPGLVLAALAAAMVTGCGTNTEPKADSSSTASETASAEPETITVDIRVSWLSADTLTSDPFKDEPDPWVGGPCKGVFDAVNEGSPVVLQDSSGETIAEGTVGAGAIGEYDNALAVPCLFPVTLEDVPAGLSQYALTVGTVDPVYVTEDELARSGTIIELVDGT